MSSKSFQPIGLITTDLHLTDRKEDNYRFDLFNWIIDNYGKSIDFLFILGDLTDRKNFHSDHLVDKISSNIYHLTKYFRVLILRGNHDYDADPNTPFFRFLGKLEHVKYFHKPSIWLGTNYNWPCRILFLPHSREPGKGWNLRKQQLNTIFLHQTFKGAKSETGYSLDGIGTTPFKRFNCPIFSGDVHVPQKVGPIEYVGSPYHVHFGDKFEPRLLLIDKDFRTKNIYFPAPHKLVIDIPHAANLRDSYHGIKPGDRAKVRLYLPIEERERWPEEQDKIRQIAEELGLILDNIILKELIRGEEKETSLRSVRKGRSRRELFNEFCKRNSIGKNLALAGIDLLE